MQGIYRVAILGLAIGMCTPAVLAQAKEDALSPPHEIQVAFNYSYMRANAAPGQCGCFNMTGGSGEVAVQAWRGFSVVADLTGEFAGSSNIPGQSLALVFVTAGPRFTYYPPSLSPLCPVRPGSDRRCTWLRCAPTTPAPRPGPRARWRRLLAAAWISPSTIT